ncbi:MAG: MotA/TolQ/ExbB proton channel family protein [Bdellovibrionales bacterium]|nr:MotA/TolQ/ExbB proton channel family protein [Bdellovibrionales bacterium]
MNMATLFKLAEASADSILWIMVILSVVSVSIMIERFFGLRKIMKSSNAMAKNFKEVILNGKLGELEKLNDGSGSLEARALGHGLDYVKGHGPEGLDDLINSFKTLEKPALEKNLNLLGTIASNAPYIGLLGTVMGIMKAFNDLANSPGQGNEVVMAGIAHALVSTAIGLGVAIPAVVAFNHFQKKVGLILGNIDAARDLCLAYIKRGV